MLATAVALGVSTVLRLELQPELPGQIGGPLFLGCVVVSAWFGGVRCGLLATLLSILSLQFFVIPPICTFNFGLADLPRIAVFLFVALLVSFLNTSRSHARNALKTARERLQAARAIQQKLFPATSPASEQFEIAGMSQPADETGGDYFDYFPMRGGSIGVVLGDVSGHGFGPALLMAETRAYLRALALVEDDPGRLLEQVNRLLADDISEGFVTVFFARIDAQPPSFVYAGAGHEAYLLNADGEAVRLSSTGLALGIEADTTISCSAALPLPCFWILVLATDGFSEAETRAGSPFGAARVLEIVHAHRRRSAREIIDRLFAAVHSACGSTPQLDDRTAIIVKNIRDGPP